MHPASAFLLLKYKQFSNRSRAGADTISHGRLLGLVFRLVFKTNVRLSESQVCSIRTTFRHPDRFPAIHLQLHSLLGVDAAALCW